MRKALCYLGFVFSGLLPLAAQSQTDGDSRREAGRSAWFVCTSIPDDLKNPVTVMAGKNLIEVELPRFMASDAVGIPEDGILRIVREVPDPENPEKPKYLVLAEAKIPAGVREALIILVPLPKPEGDLVFLAQVQDLSKFKGGDRLFINLSDTHIRVRFGTTTVNVPAKEANIYETPVLAEPTNMPVMYEFFHPERKEWKMLSASTVVLRPTRREISIFNEGSRPGNIKKHKILFPVRKKTP